MRQWWPLRTVMFKLKVIQKDEKERQRKVLSGMCEIEKESTLEYCMCHRSNIENAVHWNMC